jgi:hypothetical protein
MSSGVFTISKYAASYGDADQIHPIRIQPETLTASIGGTANSAPAGAVNNPIQCRSAGGKRQIGLAARYIVIKFPATGQPAGYAPSGTTRIPALTETFYNAATKGTAITYLTVATCQIVSRSRERVDGSDGG